MATVAESPALSGLEINQELFHAVAKSTQNALDMCDIRIRCVGVSSMPALETGMVTGMIGVYGKASGFLSVNMAEPFVINAVSGLLGERFEKLTSQVVDGAGEITNIIVGGVKSALSNTEWGFSQITVPSVIIGQNFTIAYARSLEFLNVTFEHEDPEIVRLEDRMLHISMSLLRV